MNTLKMMLTATCLLAAPALAQAQGTTTPGSTQTPPAATTSPRAGMPATTATTSAADARRASQIIGANVINEENRTIGEVDDLMVSANDGSVTTAVLSVGGFLGIGERYVAVPISNLRWNTEHSRWMLPGATVDSLKARPAFSYPNRG